MQLPDLLCLVYTQAAVPKHEISIMCNVFLDSPSRDLANSGVCLAHLFGGHIAVFGPRLDLLWAHDSHLKGAQLAAWIDEILLWGLRMNLTRLLRLLFGLQSHVV